MNILLLAFIWINLDKPISFEFGLDFEALLYIGVVRFHIPERSWRLCGTQGWKNGTWRIIFLLQ